jgi:energy-coupling factor transport system substrate-specific component
MRELFTVWRDTRMVMLVAVTAAVYAALLIPFAGLVIIPGVTNVRPGNVIPVVFGIMFGPAGAWGSAIGNLINDLFAGTFGPGNVFGFIGNFFYGLIGYKLWGSLGPLSSGEEPTMRSPRQLLEFGVIAIVASGLCAAIIAWGLEILGLFPFSVLGTIILLNNFLATIVLGPPILYLVYPRIKEMGLLYPDVMLREDLPTAGASRATSAPGARAGVAVAWIVIGIAVSLGIQDVPFAVGTDETFGQGGSTVQIALGAVAFLAILTATAASGERFSSILG